MHDLFRKSARHVSYNVGSGWTFMLALGLVSGTGWYFDFSDKWKNNVGFISTLTVLLLLFFLQKSQNHSDKATHLKLDELIQALDGARDEIVSAEEQTEKNMDELKRDVLNEEDGELQIGPVRRAEN